MENRNKMKKILLFPIAIVFVAGMFSACSDWLELTPEDDLVSSEFWKSQKDVEALLFNTYGRLAGEVKTLLLWGELRGGLISEGRSVPSDASKIIRGDVTDQNSLARWSGLYKVINGANQILAYAPGVREVDPSFTAAELRQIRSEALFLRSMAYFYLVRTFREVPLILDPYVSDEQDYYPPKSAESTLMEQITADLELALEGAPEAFDNTENTKGRATVFAVHALLTDVYLWQEDYESALLHAGAITSANRYGLMGANNWFQNFYPGNSNSSIFEIQFSKKWDSSSGLYETFSYQKSKQYTINPRVVEIFSTEDVRGVNATYAIANLEIWKYIGINETEERGDALNDNNFIVYRLADILLLQAEALAELQRFDEALDIINEIRSRRGVPPLSPEPNILAYEETILQERARELAFEGKYWFDLIRFAKRDGYRNKEKVIAALTLNASADAIPALTAKFQDPYSWYLPIHRDELQINNNLEQNPYYKK
jgi:hypothetical protein